MSKTKPPYERPVKDLRKEFSRMKMSLALAHDTCRRVYEEAQSLATDDTLDPIMEQTLALVEHGASIQMDLMDTAGKMADICQILLSASLDPDSPSSQMHAMTEEMYAMLEKMNRD